MDVNRFKIVGIDNITTSEYVTIPQDGVGMTSSGSPMASQEICIFILAFLMLVIWKDILIELLESIISKEHEIPFPIGKTWPAVEQNENSCAPIGEASDGDGYHLGKRGRRCTSLEKIFERK